MWDPSEELAALRAADLYRQPRRIDVAGPTEAWVDGRRCTVFCSNDYLGLAQHPSVVEAFTAAAQRDGVGSGAAHLITGHRREHEALEEELAEFLGRDRVLLFSTGYMANMGVIDALASSGDGVFQDRLNHASLLDGARLSGAKRIRYRHADAEHLRMRLGAEAVARRLVVTDGVFSMDGDLAPLPAISQLAAEHDATLIVDDAHGIGVIGKQGRGVLEYYGLAQQQVPLLIGTLGKGLGTFGAFVAGPAPVVEYLVQKARTFMFTTAQPPAVAAATRASLQLVRTESWRRDKLQTLIARFRRGAEQLGLPLMASQTPIQPLLVGEAQRALRLGEQLMAAGMLVTPIRPPTVPPGSARLRITFSAEHSEEQVDRLLDAFERLKLADSA
ncbi:8-amino-7-oxononanoate synthase [Alkalilimnicola ehrlichii]|uniref:8-amino-7-oxononanoate synthase n=1 Tax=Alkalilimnicola ehrlichii TaxID=351052 RepID=A0A3E0X3C4_9GAMM|nr:8-amino-7-oxononanoate synthase [Alkalilimnicola ehrlichii]RFA39538.1 8-amino-7-oxononanoate synthase [Alkalilimnicola ehrlichii]